MSIRTCFAIPLQRISLPTAPTCASYKRCSATQVSPPHKSILTRTSRVLPRLIANSILEGESRVRSNARHAACVMSISRFSLRRRAVATLFALVPVPYLGWTRGERGGRRHYIFTPAFPCSYPRRSSRWCFRRMPPTRVVHRTFHCRHRRT